MFPEILKFSWHSSSRGLWRSPPEETGSGSSRIIGWMAPALILLMIMYYHILQYSTLIIGTYTGALVL